MARSFLTHLPHFLIALSLGACCIAARPAVEVQTFQPTWEIPVWVDSSFAAKEKQDIAKALVEWSAGSGGYMHLYLMSDKVSYPADKNITFADLIPGGGLTISLERPSCDTCEEHPMFLAWTNRIGGANIHLIERRIVSDHYNFLGIVEHEMGHALGLSHSDHSGNLMSPDIDSQTLCVDEESLKRVFRLHKWDVSYINPQCGG